MNYKIDVVGELLILKFENKTNELEINDFQYLRPNTNGCCDFFLHLASKYESKPPLELFYDLAKKINQLLPNHKINWAETFYNVSKELYNSALTIKGDKSEGDNESFTAALDDDEVEIELSDLKTRKAFLDGVNDRLISEGIITEYRFDN
jgi:hypothetical protein